MSQCRIAWLCYRRVPLKRFDLFGHRDLFRHRCVAFALNGDADAFRGGDTGIAVGLPVAAANRAVFARANLRLRLASAGAVHNFQTLAGFLLAIKAVRALQRCDPAADFACWVYHRFRYFSDRGHFRFDISGVRRNFAVAAAGRQ
mgnify:CR=1 FL=1